MPERAIVKIIRAAFGGNQILANTGRKATLEVMTMLVIDRCGLMFWYGLVMRMLGDVLSFCFVSTVRSSLTLFFGRMALIRGVCVVSLKENL
jgi:hypothetical protein